MENNDNPIDIVRRRRRALDAAVAKLASQQEGLVARRQLLALGMDADRVRNHVAASRWAERSALVLSTTTGPLTRAQTRWLGVLHAGPRALVGGLSAAEVHGLRNWHRDETTILIPQDLELDDLAAPDVRFIRTRRSLAPMATKRDGLPVCRIEPAVLLFAAYQPSLRTAQGLVAAVVQQRLTTHGELQHWVRALRPLRWAKVFRAALTDIAGGSQSLAELDVLRLCRRAGLQRPRRQGSRRDSSGRVRWTDCEWELPDGHVIVLEVDGAFHMEAEHWEDDLARQRRISRPGRTVVRCTAREARDEPEQVGRDLRALGVPGRAAEDAS